MMGLLSNQISRETLKPGDHIYSWRNAYTYSHHGIYVGDEKVIHFTRGGDLETGTGTFLDKFIASCVPNHGGDNNPCPKCGDQSKLHGVISSCLDCFLAGGNLYLFEYGVSPAFFVAKQRGGTCTTAPSDPPEEVIFRAKFLLLRNGFGAYHLFENNCEDFAIYCKTSLVVMSKIKLGRSGQANSASIARDAVSSTLGLLGVVNASGRAASVFSSTVRYVVPSFGAAFGGLVLVGQYGKYCMDRLNSDIGRRSDVTKLTVQGLECRNATPQQQFKSPSQQQQQQQESLQQLQQFVFKLAAIIQQNRAEKSTSLSRALSDLQEMIEAMCL